MTPTRHSSDPTSSPARSSITPEEAAAFVKSRVDELHAQAEDDIHYDDAIWQAENYTKTANLRTSLIVEPRNGKVPPLTAQGQARLAQQRATQRASAGVGERASTDRSRNVASLGATSAHR